MSYGYCRCGAKVVSRTRGIPSYDTCDNGHTSPARMTLSYDPMASAKGRAEKIMEEAMKAAMQVEEEQPKVEEPANDEGQEIDLESLPPMIKFLLGDTADGVTVMLAPDGPFVCQAESELPEAKFVTPEPLPTAYENELLDCLIEECAEVIQRATKMKRFGVKEVQPGQDFTNAERLSQEIGDAMAVMERAAHIGLMDWGAVERQLPVKHAKLDEFLQHSPDEEEAA